MEWRGERKKGTFVVYYGGDGQRLKRRRRRLIEQLHGRSVLKDILIVRSFPRNRFGKRRRHEKMDADKRRR